MVAVPLEVPAVAVKPALADPAATVTEAGTLTAAWLDDRPIVKAEVAALVKVTVQAEVPPGFSVVGEQLRADSAAGAVNPSTKLREPPLRLAVRVALVSLDTAAAVAVKPALLDPAATVTEAGTLAAPLSLDSATLAPPVGAAAVSATVQALVPGVTTEAGLQLRLAG